MTPSLVDIGANLTNKAFRADLAAVLQRAREAGVTRIVVTGTSVPESRRAAELAEQHPGTLWATAGVHPHHARDCGAETLQQLRELVARPEVVALGECGLDFNRDFSPREDQRHWFEQQVALAAELQLPMFLHEREAASDLLAVLDRYRDRLDRVCVHCFTGDGDVLDSYLQRGFFIGITGWVCDERRGTHLQELLPRIPMDRLMLETDCPYLVPRTMHPKAKKGRNEPAFLVHVLATVAECLGKEPDEVAAATSRTSAAFFGIGGVPAG